MCMHRFISGKHEIPLPCERNAHFRKSATATMSIGDLKCCILPFIITKTKDGLILRKSVTKGVVLGFIESNPNTNR